MARKRNFRYLSRYGVSRRDKIKSQGTQAKLSLSLALWCFTQRQNKKPRHASETFVISCAMVLWHRDKIKSPSTQTALGQKTKRPHAQPTALHESRNLKQARPFGQYVDLLRNALATPSFPYIIPQKFPFVNPYFSKATAPRTLPRHSLRPLQNYTTSSNKGTTPNAPHGGYTQCVFKRPLHEVVFLFPRGCFRF